MKFALSFADFSLTVTVGRSSDGRALLNLLTQSWTTPDPHKDPGRGVVKLAYTELDHPRSA